MSSCILNGRSSKQTHGISCGDDLYLKEGVYLDAYGGSIDIGRGTTLGQYSAIHGNGGVRIGDYFMMGHGALILASNHLHNSGGTPFLFQGSKSRGVTIGSNVWLGAGAVILDGTSIGDNVVIGAGTVVHGTIASDQLVYSSRDLITKSLDMPDSHQA